MWLLALVPSSSETHRGDSLTEILPQASLEPQMEAKKKVGKGRLLLMMAWKDGEDQKRDDKQMLRLLGIRQTVDGKLDESGTVKSDEACREWQQQ